MIHNIHQLDSMNIGPIRTSKTELEHLFRAWIAISIAFAIVLGGFSFSPRFVYLLLISAFTVGIGFLFHELGHKLVAQRYHCWAEFRANDQMLLFAIVMSFFGFVFAAPGAVMILGNVSHRKNGKISLAGPLVNLALAILFLAAAITLPINSLLVYYGFLINTWLGLFNMLPFGNFDGIKILRWNKVVYGITVSVALFLLIIQQFI